MLPLVLWSFWSEMSVIIPENSKASQDFCCWALGLCLQSNLERDPWLCECLEVLVTLQHAVSLLALAFYVFLLCVGMHFSRQSFLITFPFFLQADEDPIMGFHQIFLLKNINDAWVCTNDMFRLALHNFGWAGDPEAPVLLFFSPLLLLILFTLTEHSKYHTQTCSTAEREQARAVTCPSAEFTLSLDEFLVHDVWKLVSCIWQEKFVLYQHASERI